jgi:hypothetical protein
MRIFRAFCDSSKLAAKNINQPEGMKVRKTERIWMVKLLMLIAGALAILYGWGAVVRANSLVWNPYPASSFIAGYIVYIGGQSHNYTTSIDVGTNTSFSLDSLPPGTTNYIAVAAYDWIGNESAPSAEYVYVNSGYLRVVSGPSVSGGMTVVFPVSAGHWYEVQTSPDLANWSTIWQTSVLTTNGLVTYSDPNPMVSPSQFYRLALH